MKNKIVTILLAILAIAILAFPIMIKDSYVVYGAGSGSSSGSSTGHSHTYPKEWSTVAPTCTSGGYDIKYCTKGCGTYITNNYTNALGHNWGDWSTILPTCTSGGYDIRACYRCGATDKANETSALGHNWEKNKYKDATQHGDQCSRCFTVENKANHTWEAVGGIEGTTHKCTECGYEAAHNGEYTSEDNYTHWKVCEACGQDYAYGNHDFNNGTDEHICNVCERVNDENPYHGFEGFGRSLYVRRRLLLCKSWLKWRNICFFN